MLVTGPLEGDRTTGLNEVQISWLRKVCDTHNLPLLIEADGSRQRPLKAPADHEPVIPELVETVVVVAGLTGLGKPLAMRSFTIRKSLPALAALKMGETITPEALVRVLTHPAWRTEEHPAQARRIVLLNQADTPELQSRREDGAEVWLQQPFNR